MFFPKTHSVIVLPERNQTNQRPRFTLSRQELLMDLFALLGALGLATSIFFLSGRI